MAKYHMRKLFFPITLTYKKEYDAAIFSEARIQFLETRLKDKNVEITQATETLVEFKVPLFRFSSQWNIMNDITYGWVKIETNHNRHALLYEVTFIREFLIMGLMLGVAYVQGLEFVRYLFPLYLFTKVVSGLRHLWFFNRLVKELKEISQYESE
jgi:hypothetical protein